LESSATHDDTDRKPDGSGNRAEPMRSWESLRRRVPVSVAVAIASAVALCLLGAFVLLRNELTSRAHRQLAQQMVGAASYYKSMQSELEGVAQLIADDTDVSTGVRRADRNALILRLMVYYNDLSASIYDLDVVDSHGKVLVELEDTMASGASVGSLPSFHTALLGRVSCGLEPDFAARGRPLVLRATEPILDGPGKPIGAVSVGRPLDSLFASQIGHAVQATVRLQAASGANGAMPRVTAPCVYSAPSEATTGAHISDSQDAGQEVLSGNVLLPGTDGGWAGLIQVVQPLSDIYDAVTNVTEEVLLLGLGIALIGAGAGVWLSRVLTRRLSALEVAAAAVAAGDLEQQMPVEGKDEIASLARSVSHMVQSLRDRMALSRRLRDTAEARVRELEGLAEIAQLLTSASSLAATLDEVAARVCAIVDCPASAIALLEEGVAPGDSAGLILRGAHGMHAETRKLLGQVIPRIPTHPDLDGSVARGTMLSRFAAIGSALDGNTIQRILIDSGELEVEIQSDEVLVRKALLDEGWKSATIAPMILQGRNQGVVVCFSRDTVRLPEAELRVLRTVVGQASVAVENARLFDRNHELAVLEERTRLARELHDSITQSLFSLNVTARAALNPRTRSDPGRLDRALGMIGELAQSSLSEMRALLFELRPAQLKGEGLVAALRNYAAAVEQRTGLPVRVDVSAACALPSRDEDALYRVTQEALANVVRHAHAQMAVVRLRAFDGWAELTIEDDGVGISQPADTAAFFDTASAGHYGIRGMRERLVALGGTLELRAGTEIGDGVGTRVTARLPLRSGPPRSPEAGTSGLGPAGAPDTPGMASTTTQ
jgi:signal transduction histidine kinase